MSDHTRLEEIDMEGGELVVNSTSSSTSRRNMRGIVAVFIIAALVALAITLAVIFTRSSSSLSSSASDNLSSPIEIASAPSVTIPGVSFRSASEALQLTADMMNDTVDPCDNFYEYACGSFLSSLSQEERDGEYMVWPTYQTIQRRNSEVLAYTMRHSNDPYIGVAYDSCFSAYDEDAHGFVPVEEIMQRFVASQWSSATDFLLGDKDHARPGGYSGTVYIPMLVPLGVSLLPTTDSTQTTRIKAVLHLTANRITPNMIFSNAVESVGALLRALGYDTESTSLVMDVLDIFDSLESTDEIDEDEDQDGASNPTPLSMDQLQSKFPSWDWHRIVSEFGVDPSLPGLSLISDNMAYFTMLASIVDTHFVDRDRLVLEAWAKTLVFVEAVGSGMFEGTNVKHVKIKSPPSLEERRKTRSKMTKRQAQRFDQEEALHRLLELHIKKTTTPHELDRARKHAAHVFRHDPTLRMRLLPRVWSRVAALYPDLRHDSCSALVNLWMGDRVGQAFVDATWPKGTDQLANRYVAFVRMAWENVFQEADWLDSDSRAAFRHKLDAVAQHVGLPEVHDYSGMKLTRNRFFSNMMEMAQFSQYRMLSYLEAAPRSNVWLLESVPVAMVNAEYWPILNAIFLPAGFWQEPVFGASYHPAINFGGYATFVGHEFGHAFDPHGVQSDAFGFERQWMSNATAQEHHDRSQCFVEQYDRISVYGHNVNGSLTVGENVADNMGIPAALRAFRLYAAANPDTVPKTNSLGLSNEQLFWVSFAQNYCTYMSDEAIEATFLDPDVHAPNKARVLGTVANSVDFADAFACPRGAPMNPVYKCKLF